VLQNPLQLAPAVIVTRPDTRVEQAGELHSESSKVSDRPML